MYSSRQFINRAVFVWTSRSKSPERSRTICGEICTWCRSSGWRIFSEKCSGAPVLSANVTGPRTAEACRPKKFTKTPSRPASWSAKKPTAQLVFKARKVSLTACWRGINFKLRCSLYFQTNAFSHLFLRGKASAFALSRDDDTVNQRQKFPVAEMREKDDRASSFVQRV